MTAVPRPRRTSGGPGVLVSRALQTHPPPDTTALHGAETVAEVLERYALLIELSPDSIVVHQRGLIVYANTASCRLMGVAGPSALLGGRIDTFVDTDDVPAMLARIGALDAPGMFTAPAEIRVRRPSGALIDVESVSVRTTWAGHPAYQVVLRDLRTQKTAEATLRYQAALVAHVSEAIIAADTQGLVTSWNPAAEEMYQWPASEAIGRPVADVIGADHFSGEGMEAVHRQRGGAPIDVRVSVAELRDDRDCVAGRVLVCSDVTQTKAAERRHAAIVESLQEGVFVVGVDGLIESLNPAGERVLHARAADVVGVAVTELGVLDATGRPFPPGEAPIAVVRRTGLAADDVTVGVPRGERHLWLSCSIRPLDTRTGAPYPVVVSFTDITERKAAAAALEYQASHDSLTGLANRTVVVQAIRAFLQEGAPTEALLTVIFLDLDHFKVVNDSLGHGVGDQMLCVAADRLQAALGPDDVVGRLGGDEFLVLARGPRTVDEAAALAQRLRDTVAVPVLIAGRMLAVGASAGVVVVPGSSRHTADVVLRDADVAMYQAKDRGRGRQQIFDSELREKALRRLQLEEDLRTALDGDELFVAFQPLVDLVTGRTLATEALLRWNHPTLGPVSPVEFIRVAEESGLIVRLGARVLQLACAQTAAWRAEHPTLSDLRVAVNLSARQLADPHLTSTVREVLSSTGLPPDALWLEITESMLMDDAEGAIRVLRALRDVGVHLSIDDFGTGYSSLSYLRRFPVEELKIDRSFIVAMGDSADDAAIVASVTALAHTLGLTVVAEGIETPEQLSAVRALGIDQAQGYLFSRPAVADDVVAFLLAGTAGTAGTTVSHVA